MKIVNVLTFMDILLLFKSLKTLYCKMLLPYSFLLLYVNRSIKKFFKENAE